MFSEDQSRYLLAVPEEHIGLIEQLVLSNEVFAGVHTGSVFFELEEKPSTDGMFDLRISDDASSMAFGDSRRHVNIALKTVRDAHEGWLPNYMSDVD